LKTKKNRQISQNLTKNKNFGNDLDSKFNQILKDKKTGVFGEKKTQHLIPKPAPTPTSRIIV